jgi:dihydroorotate dehydrogenase (NAD+) catalytic subunit
VVVNAAGVTKDEFVELATVLGRTDGVHALELNLSCPNVAAGGMSLGVDPGTASSVVAAVRAATELPLLVKLPPQTHLLADIAAAVHAEGADAVTLVNTLPAMDVDPIARRPRLGNVTGGLSGPALRPVALAAVWRARRRCEVPIVGVGGITSSLHAVAFLLCGASAVQIGTGLFGDPLLPVRVLEGIEGYCAEQSVRRVADLVGSLRLPE